MLTLYLLRHAKSSWSDPSIDDHERPLNERGLANAPFMASLFKERNEPVDHLLTSTAVRARTTAGAFQGTLGMADDRLTLSREAYLASPPTLLRLINAMSADSKRVLIVGHNPGLSELAALLTTEEVGDLPTSGMVRIDLPFDDWKLVSAGTGTLVWMDYPKRYPDAY